MSESIVRIGVKTLTGNLYLFDVDPRKETVVDLMKKMRDKGGLPVDSQLMIFNRRQLSHSNTLESCGVKKGSQIRLLLRLGGPIRRYQPDEKEKMNLNVVVGDVFGKTQKEIKLPVFLTDSMYNIQMILQGKTGILCPKQRLTFGKTMISPFSSETLENLGFKNNSSLGIKPLIEIQFRGRGPRCLHAILCLDGESKISDCLNQVQHKSGIPLSCLLTNLKNEDSTWSKSYSKELSKDDFQRKEQPHLSIMVADSRLMTDNPDMPSWKSYFDKIESLTRKESYTTPRKTCFSPSDKDEEKEKEEIQKRVEKCCVCLSKFQSMEMVRRLECLHKFHCSCIDSWIFQHSSCPECRFQVKWKNVPQKQKGRTKK